MRVPSGQPIRLDFTVEDLSGQPVTPGSVSLKLLDALGLINTLDPPTLDGVGKYHSELDEEIEPVGHYEWVFRTTAPGKTVQSGSIDVYDPLAAELLSLESGKRYLKIADDDTSFDTEVAGFIRALTPTIEFFVGPVEPKTMRRSVFGTYEIVLPVAPVLSITAIEGYGVTALAPDLLVDTDLGIVRHTTGLLIFPYGRGVLTFVAGRRVIPDSISHAAKVILDHLWETQRGRGSTYTGSRRQSSDTTFVPQLGYSVPNRAIELLKPLSTKTGLS